MEHTNKKATLIFLVILTTIIASIFIHNSYKNNVNDVIVNQQIQVNNTIKEEEVQKNVYVNQAQEENIQEQVVSNERVIEDQQQVVEEDSFYKVDQKRIEELNTFTNLETQENTQN